MHTKDRHKECEKVCKKQVYPRKQHDCLSLEKELSSSGPFYG